MGHYLNSDPTACKDLLDDGNLPAQYRPLEHFICKVYSQQTTIDTLLSLRWELFRKKNLEGEKLPPTRGTLIPHILRANCMSQRDKSYITAKQCFQLWNIMDEKSIPKGNMYQWCALRNQHPKPYWNLSNVDVKAFVTLQTVLAWEMVFRALLFVNAQTVQMFRS